MEPKSLISTASACQATKNSVEGKESAAEHLRRNGMILIRSVVRRYGKYFKPQRLRKTLPTWAQVPPNIAVGDRVQVRNLDEIDQTLDERGCTKGCAFIPQMADFCSLEFQVGGKVEKFFDEARFRTLQCKNLVYLKDVYCDGSIIGGCDRSCFIFWRTEWLKKLD